MATRLPGNSSTKATTANVTIDEHDIHIVKLGISPAAMVTHNQPIFETPELSYGQHSIDILYNGDEDSVPLELSYMYVWAGSSASQNTISASKKSNVGAIVGGAVGGFFGLIAVLVALWIVYSRKTRKDEIRAWEAVWRNRTRNSKIGIESMEMG
jgi:hypothetical protein